MYTGVVMSLAGYVIAWGGVFSWIPCLACAAFYVVKGVKEEQLLAAKYPEYDDYRKNTWRFIPFVH